MLPRPFNIMLSGPRVCMGEFSRFSIIQDFEAYFLWKVSLKILNKAEYNSFSDIFTVYLKAINHLNLKY